ncbi:nucleoside hydrolase [Mycobacterium fragae]|uniref:Nucleoside hydrolase n=1 Tax=Mycobacterium fragae TaxID=1260918 RepID=A0A1X1URC0_9MYCO|nr:nucleoside hydrolase [Mycobacterium fragae]MCV7401921.1 nucleoside hydrolase [Mycobacterium fragae]ORV59261.1 nucleoside hydrolase [Mycobacterium fragae]
MNASPVFADVDTGVDDALALVYMLGHAQAELVGIASTGGNVAVEQVCENNLGLLELCRVGDIPVSKGADQPLSCPMCPPGKAHGPKGLGYAELPSTDRRLTAHDAATAWVEAAHAHPGELIGVATGPLTNLALALRAEPTLPTLLRRLVIMGGAYDYRGNTNPVAEWNISVDPEAAAEVFAGWVGAERLPILCGLELTQRIAMTPEHLARLGTTGRLVRFIEDAMRFYFEAHRDAGYGYLAHLHDPLAAAVALDPQLVTTRPATVDVELAGTLTRGMTVTDWSGRWGREPNALIGVGVDPTVFFDQFIDRVGAFARRLG